jgi:predicted dehydrogenase
MGYKFMIAGLGSIGRRHLRNLIALGEEDILLYRTHRSTLPDDDLAEFPVETDLKIALAHNPDAVIVSNPTSMHLDVAIPAVEAGCHVLLEKPISHNRERLGEFKQLVENNKSRVLVGFQFRYHPGLLQVLKMLDENVLGRPLSVRAHWGEYLPDWHPWEDYRKGYSARADLGGGVILTLAHPLDYLRLLLGEVQALWAFSSCMGDLELDVEDAAEIGLQFENGIIGSVHVDYNQRPSAHHLEIIGTRGSLYWDNGSGETKVYFPELEDWITYPIPDGFERNNLFLDQMRHFLEIVKDGVEPFCTLNDGIRALELALAVHESAKEGKLVRFG